MSHYRPKDGKDGLPGTHGKDGRDGERGDTGPAPDHDWVGTHLRFKAPDGEFGEFVDLEGPPGKDGKDGLDGKDGADGKDGRDGKNGRDGKDGTDGKDGEKGDIGPMPDHQWRDTSLRFQDPDGTWGRYVNLKGEKGDPGIPGSSGGGMSRITASKVEVATLPGATYNNVQEVINVMFSPGIITGGEVTELSPTVVRIAGGTAVARVADDNTSELRFFDFVSQDFSVPDIQVTHFYALDYNGGSPVMVESTVTENWDRDTEIPLGSAVRGDGFLNVTPNPYRTGDVITNLIQRLDAVSPVQRDNSVGGLILGQTGTRNVTVTAGRIWSRVSDFSIASKNSSVDEMSSVFFNGTNLTVTSGITQWDNQNYNDMGTGTLVPVGNNKWANLWFFMSFDGTHYGFAYGTADYNSLGQAANEGIPAYLTQNFFNQFVLVGRFIFQESSAIPGQIESAFNTPFNTQAINNHNDLGGLQGGSVGEFYHLTNAQNAAVAAAIGAGGGLVNIAGTQTVTGAKTFDNDVTISGASRRIRGDFSSGTPSDRVSFQTNVANSLTVVQAIPGGTSDVSALVAYNTSAINNSAYFIALASLGGISFGSSTNGVGVPIPFTVIVGGSAVMVYNLGPGFHVTPGQDNLQNFGSSALRWKEIFAANPTINTSDATEKTIRGALTAEELSAASDIAGAIVGFKWKDEIIRDGESAKVHFGLTAQGVAAIMQSHGLDPSSYGFVHFEQWDKIDAIEAIPEMGIEARPEIPAGSRYGLRYSEVLAFVAAAQEQRIRALEATI